MHNRLQKSKVSFLHLSFVNTLRPRQNGRHFPDDIFKYTFLKESVRILTKNGLALTRRQAIIWTNDG